MTSQTAKRIVAISLAEATLDLVLPWVQAGKLPHFKRLMETGSWGTLQSVFPFVTPQMWGNILTGTNPGHHGVFDFWQRGYDGRFREINGAALQEKTMWQVLTEKGLSSGIVNVPFTYPPPPLQGYLIAGEDAPGAHRSIAHPPQIYDEVVSACGRYRLKDIFPGGRQKSDYLTLVEEDVTRQADVACYLLEQHPTDFFLSFFSATAITQHYFWADMVSEDADNPYRGVIETAYHCLDTAIGRLLQAAGPEATIFVFSECGAGPLLSGVQVNAWLAREGFLRYQETSGSKDSPGHSGIAQMRKQAQAMLQKRMPKSMYFMVNRYLGGLKAWMQNQVYESGIDWAHTQAFSRGKEGSIFINLKGRDPHGIVAPGEAYASICRDITERLGALVDPSTDKPAVAAVYRAHELYNGPMMEFAPDLVVRWRDELYFPTESAEDRNAVFVPRWREYMNWPTSGNHRLDGMLFAAGPVIAKDKQIEGTRILDLMPTWLHILGQPVPDHLEGRVMQGLFE